MEEITFETLVSYHKQEGQEALAYLTILFTVIIGIIGFLGSASKVEKSARALMSLFYVGLHLSMVNSFIASMKIHSAIHQEIAYYVVNHPSLFLQESYSPLYTELSQLHGHNIQNMMIAGYALLVIVLLCILSVGTNSILDWSKLTVKLKSR